MYLAVQIEDRRDPYRLAVWSNRFAAPAPITSRSARERRPRGLKSLDSGAGPSALGSGLAIFDTGRGCCFRSAFRFQKSTRKLVTSGSEFRFSRRATCAQRARRSADRRGRGRPAVGAPGVWIQAEISRPLRLPSDLQEPARPSPEGRTRRGPRDSSAACDCVHLGGRADSRAAPAAAPATGRRLELTVPSRAAPAHARSLQPHPGLGGRISAS